MNKYLYLCACIVMCIHIRDLLYRNSPIENSDIHYKIQ